MEESHQNQPNSSSQNEPTVQPQQPQKPPQSQSQQLLKSLGQNSQGSNSNAHNQFYQYQQMFPMGQTGMVPNQFYPYGSSGQNMAHMWMQQPMFYYHPSQSQLVGQNVSKDQLNQVVAPNSLSDPSGMLFRGYQMGGSSQEQVKTSLLHQINETEESKDPRDNEEEHIDLGKEMVGPDMTMSVADGRQEEGALDVNLDQNQLGKLQGLMGMQMDTCFANNLQTRLKDLEFDNFRLEKKLQEVMSKQWRLESQYNNYLFQSHVREKYETSSYYCKGEEITKKTYHVHFVDYLSVNSFKRIQDAIDVAKEHDKIVVHAGVYCESIVINKQLAIISNGYVELRSNCANVITCGAPSEGCLIKGFTVRRLDGSKIDPTSCGMGGTVQPDRTGTYVSDKDIRNDKRDEDEEPHSKPNVNGGRYSSENKFSIYVKEGRVTIEECDMLSECGTVVFCNPRSHTKLVKNRICGSIGSGVMVTGKGARLFAEDNHIYGGTGCGIDVRNQASCTLIKNKIHNCDKSGIYILMTSEAKIYRNEIWENHFSGIEVTNAQKVEIVNNKIYQNKRAGLYFHTESVVFAENNEIVENKNANVIMKEKSKVTMVHNFIARSVGSGLVILTGSGCKFEENVIKQCLNNGIDLCNGDIYASNNIIVENERSGLYGNGHIKGCFQMNKIIGNKLQSWNNGLCKYIMDQEGKGGQTNVQTLQKLSKERFVMFRNIDDCEFKSLEYGQKQMLSESSSKKLTEAEIEMRKYDQKMLAILRDLDKIEQNFFVPLNAHPLKKSTEAAGFVEHSKEEELCVSMSEQYKQWSVNSKKQFFDNRGPQDFDYADRSKDKHRSPRKFDRTSRFQNQSYSSNNTRFGRDYSDKSSKCGKKNYSRSRSKSVTSSFRKKDSCGDKRKKRSPSRAKDFFQSRFQPQQQQRERLTTGFGSGGAAVAGEKLQMLPGGDSEGSNLVPQSQENSQQLEQGSQSTQQSQVSLRNLLSGSESQPTQADSSKLQEQEELYKHAFPEGGAAF